MDRCWWLRRCERLIGLPGGNGASSEYETFQQALFIATGCAAYGTHESDHVATWAKFCKINMMQVQDGEQAVGFLGWQAVGWASRVSVAVQGFGYKAQVRDVHRAPLWRLVKSSAVVLSSVADDTKKARPPTGGRVAMALAGLGPVNCSPHWLAE